MQRGAGILTAGMLACVALTGPAGAQQARPFSGTPPVWPLNTLKDLHQAFFGCMTMPPERLSQPGVEMTILFALNTSGA
ncbi:MAG: hypothetical protein AB7K04_11305, partial [Pseudorhodoplanes sp.]